MAVLPRRSPFIEVTDMLRFIRDANGYPRAEGEGAYQLLGTFLEQDVQGSLNGCNEYLGIISQIRSGLLPEWSGLGNAHNVSITESGVVIENEWAIPNSRSTVSLDEFENAIRQWAALISHRGGDAPQKPTSK
jgi:hypothetical protein